MTPSFGINVIGYVSSNVSLGITARHFIKLFLDKEIPVSVYDIDYNRAPNAKSNEFDSLTIKPGTELPYSINLFFLSMGQLPDFFLNPPSGIFSPDKTNAGLIWCEETVIPKKYCEALRLFDVLMAGSHFVRQVFNTNISDILTIDCIHPLFLPSGTLGDRNRFNLPKDKLLFISSFDPHHDPERKNPFGAIDSFLTAFPESSGENDLPHLVVKLNNAEIKSHHCDPMALVNQLKNRCTDNPRVHFIAESLSYPDVISLYASCDVFVSMHRAEGLGLGPLECMSLGKPVIATAWSGNMSFMTHTNSCLVGYDLVPYTGMAENGPDQLGTKAVWAEPHIDEAADWMQKLASDKEMRQKIGQQAAQDTVQYQKAAECALFIDELKAISNEKSFLARRKQDKTQNLAALKQAKLNFDFYGWSGFKKRIKYNLDKYLLWRFNKN